MPNINQIIDEDSINPVDLHFTQQYHSNSNHHLTQQQQQQAHSNGVTKNKKLFPKKLWDLINDEKYNFCLRWSDDGQLVYLNRDDFEDSYLKTAENQFHTQKAISFVRQMNMYGFRKVDDCYYENDNFKRDSEHLLKNMIRKHPNKNQNNGDISPSSFDNLYSRNNVSTNSRITTPSTATTPTSLLQQSTNVSLLAPQNSIDPSFPSHLAYPIYSGSQLYNNSRDSILANQHQRLTINEDSLSSSGDFCCSAGSSQNDTLTSVLDRIDNSTNQQFNDLQNGLSEVENNANMTKRRAAAQPNLHAHHAFLDPFHFSQGNSPIGEGSGQNLMAANQYHNNQFGNFPSFNMNFNMMNLKPLMATPNSSPSHNENNCDGLNQQQNSLQALYPDQREIIKALMAQQHQQQSQTNSHLLGDLNATLPQSQFNFQQDHNNLGAFYSILASINSNLYRPADHILQGNQQNLAFDINRFPNLQQLYQNLLVQQEYLVPSESRQNSQTPRRSESSGFQSSAPNGTDSIVTSSIIQDKSTSNTLTQENISNESENGSKNGLKPNEKINDKNNGKLPSETDSSLKRRDNKANRSFKRSADSILDSHNNHGSEKVNGFKKIIIEHENARNNDNNDKFVNKYAKNLVAQIASAKSARVDSDVIAEASRYTERFVETLFDTAQVIARHSNGSGSSDSLSENRPIAEDKESNDERETERQNINLSDITSAVKLLPSKLPKILK